VGKPSLIAAQPYAKAEGRMFLLVPAYPGCPRTKAVKRLLLLLFSLVLNNFKKQSKSDHLFKISLVQHDSSDAMHFWGSTTLDKLSTLLTYKVCHPVWGGDINTSANWSWKLDLQVGNMNQISSKCFKSRNPRYATKQKRSWTYGMKTPYSGPSSLLPSQKQLRGVIITQACRLSRIYNREQNASSAVISPFTLNFQTFHSTASGNVSTANKILK